jgi:hypothetical protein
MSIAMPPEDCNPSAAPAGTELRLDNRDSAASSSDQFQQMDIEDQMEEAGQNRSISTWQNWIYYVVIWLMLFSGFAVIISGMTSRQENGWGSSFIV